jgi:Ulp1 family protease
MIKDDSDEPKYWEVHIKDCPQQTNSSDCGVCVCLNINLLAADRLLNYKFSHGDNSGSRKKREHIQEALIRGSLDDVNDYDLAKILY